MTRLWRRLAGRGWFIPAFFLLIAAPALFQILLPDPQRDERRVLATMPALPATPDQARHLPDAIDGWLKDRFGLRQPLVRINNWLRWQAFGEIATPRIIIGRHGRLFLAGHDDGPATLITGLCGADADDAAIDRGAGIIVRGLERVRAAGLDAALLLVPTAPRLYPEDIPEPFATACAGRRPPVDRVAALVAASDVGPDLIYPIDLMLGLKAGSEPIPRHHFHWAGEAPVRVAEDVAERHWQLPRTLTLPLRTKGRNSDLNGLNPGMGASDAIREPDARAVGIRTCEGAACGPIDGLTPGAEFVLERYTRPEPGPRLLIIADSFGDEISRNFLEQFGEVWRVVTNNLPALSPTDRRVLADELKARFQGERVLYIYHDAAALGGLTVIADLFWPPPA
ncbi:MAG: hypothetical protein JWO51_4937 [Rhodospirillales bacterium]|nr:hypothetical protein [Rhodospirillales bacterium]